MRLLGGFSAAIYSPEPCLVPISSARQRALLAYLALRPGYAKSRERLATLFWTDVQDGEARKRLRQSLQRLKRDLIHAGVDPLRAGRETLALDADAIQVDAEEFMTLSKSDAEADLEQAFGLYQGEFLDGITVDVEPFDEWIIEQRSRFRALAARVFERCVTARDARGDAEGAINAAERLLALDPLNEAALRLLVEQLARHRGRAAVLLGGDRFQHAEAARQGLYGALCDHAVEITQP